MGDHQQQEGDGPHEVDDVEQRPIEEGFARVGQTREREPRQGLEGRRQKKGPPWKRGCPGAQGDAHEDPAQRGQPDGGEPGGHEETIEPACVFQDRPIRFLAIPGCAVGDVRTLGCQGQRVEGGVGEGRQAEPDSQERHPRHADCRAAQQHPVGIEAGEHERYGIVRHQRSPPQARFVDARVESVGIIPHELDEIAMFAPVRFTETNDEGIPDDPAQGADHEGENGPGHQHAHHFLANVNHTMLKGSPCGSAAHIGDGQRTWIVRAHSGSRIRRP